MNAFGLINLGVLPLLLEAMAPGNLQIGTRDLEGMNPQQGQEAQPRPQEEPRRPNRQEQPQRRPERLPSPGQPTRPDRPQRPPEPRPNPQPGRPSRPDQPQRPPQAPPQAPPDRPTRPDRPQRPPESKPLPHPPRPGRPDQPFLPREQPFSPTHPLGQNPGHQAETPRRPGGRNDYTRQHRGTWPDRRAHDWQAEHRNWQERGGYEGYRIPYTRYRNSFGPRHGFRMSGYPLLVIDGFPRFQFSGLWFSILDPWPEYWSDDWYGSDELYIELFGGGYYLCNRRYPMDRIAVDVYL